MDHSGLLLQTRESASLGHQFVIQIECGSHMHISMHYEVV